MQPSCVVISSFLKWRLTLSNCKFSYSKTLPVLLRTIDHFQGKQNKMIPSLYNHTKHTPSPEKWQRFTCIQSHVPECPSVVVNYEWAIKFLSTLNVFHFLIMRHWGISSSEIRYLISNMKCAKSYTMSSVMPGYRGLWSWEQEFRFSCLFCT